MKAFFWSPLILQKFIWIPTRIILKFFVHFKINGLENLSQIEKNAIFALNHTSELDPILLPAALPFWSRMSPIFYTSREEKFYNNSGWRRHFYGGTFFKAWGAYPVFTGLKNYEKSLSHHISIVKNGGSMCVFPEGRITRDGHIHEAKGGITYLAYVTKTPIVPVRLDGAYGLGMWEFLLRRRTVSISFGERFDVNLTNPSLEDYKMIANDIMQNKVGSMVIPK